MIVFKLRFVETVQITAKMASLYVSLEFISFKLSVFYLWSVACPCMNAWRATRRSALLAKWSQLSAASRVANLTFEYGFWRIYCNSRAGCLSLLVWPIRWLAASLVAPFCCWVRRTRTSKWALKESLTTFELHNLDKESRIWARGCRKTQWLLPQDR